MDAVNSLAGTVGSCYTWLADSLGSVSQSQVEAQIKQAMKDADWFFFINRRAGGFVRIAGLSGAAAVVIGAYAAHAMKEKSAWNEERNHVFQTAQKHHMFHTVALLAVPLCRRPNLVGALLTAGMAIFCGSCYYHALSGEPKFRAATPYGGMLLITAWLAIAI